MANRSSIHGDALLLLLLLLAVASIFSLLTHELPRRSAFAVDFEGFDSDELEEDNGNIPSAPSPAVPSPPSSDPVTRPPSSFDFWDEDEFEGIPAQFPTSADTKPSVPVSQTPSLPLDFGPPSPRHPLSSYTVEIVCISFLIAFAVNYFVGSRQNELIALHWAAKFAAKNTIFHKSFSLLGTGERKEDEPPLLKEGQDVFKFYASGRRNCLCLQATMELQNRHDLIARILRLVFPRKDIIKFEVEMNENAMDHVVLAVARKKLAKAMHEEEPDLQRYATLIAEPPEGRRWVAEELAVVAESKEVAGDLINDIVLDQVFGDEAFENFGKWFISLHFSDQHPASHKKILMFKFVLPDASNMADIARFITLVPYYIDLIGRYKLSSQVRSKTEAARTKAAQEAFRELKNAGLEALQALHKREAEKKLQEVAEANLNPEAHGKREEKERARQMKKVAPKVKILRSH